MNSTKQYQLNGNELILRVKKSPVFIRFVMFLFAILFFLIPLTSMIVYMASGKGFHFGFLFGIFFFGIMGFYLLRVALWNTYGSEVISLDKNKISYVADYKYFKDGKKQKEITDSNMFSIRRIGYEDDNTGTLVIGFDEPIMCVTKIPNAELKELIEKLNDADNSA